MRGNIFRTVPEFVYLSDDREEEVTWTDFPPGKPGPEENGEDCVQITQVQWTGDWFRGSVDRHSEWRAIWNDGEQTSESEHLQFCENLN